MWISIPTQQCSQCILTPKAISQILTTFSFPLLSWFQTNNATALEQVSEGFAEQSRGVFQGCIGALDGIAIRIKLSNSCLIADPTAYFSRKGFYALNVQFLCIECPMHLWCKETSFMPAYPPPSRRHCDPSDPLDCNSLAPFVNRVKSPHSQEMDIVWRGT